MSQIPQRTLYIILAVFTAAGIFSAARLIPAPPHGLGSADFIEYWTAGQLAARGDNPYDPRLLLVEQKRLEPERVTPLMMWNPPWILVIMAPVLSLPFETAAAAWLLLNGVLLGAAGLLVVYALDRPRAWGIAFLGTASFVYPLWLTLQTGQVSGVLTFGAALIFLGLVQSRNFLIGIGLALLTLKPHLFYLVFVAVCWWSLGDGRRSVIGWAAGMTAVLVAAASLFSPSLVAFWFEGFQARGSTNIGVGDWVPATGTAIARYLLGDILGGYPAWPMVVIPGIVACLLWIYLMRQRPKINWKLSMPPLLCISIFTSPYGWVFDYMPLVIVQIVLLERCEREKSFRSTCVLGVLLMAQAGSLALLANGHTGQHEYFWFPLLLYLLWAGAVGRSLIVREVANYSSCVRLRIPLR